MSDDRLNKAPLWLDCLAALLAAAVVMTVVGLFMALGIVLFGGL